MLVECDTARQGVGFNLVLEQLVLANRIAYRYSHSATPTDDTQTASAV